MSTNEIQSKVNDLRELRRMAEELQAEIDAIQDAIKEHMTAENADELAGVSFLSCCGLSFLPSAGRAIRRRFADENSRALYAPCCSFCARAL